MAEQDRVAWFFLDRVRQREAVRLIELPMSRREIAEYLGLTVERVCRVLTLFADVGIIAIPTVGQIEIIDAGARERIRRGGDQFEN